MENELNFKFTFPDGSVLLVKNILSHWVNADNGIVTLKGENLTIVVHPKDGFYYTYGF